MKLYDCFTYFNEADMLYLRLNELNHRINHFVLVEATQTFTGEPKPLYFDELPEWISDWKDRIIRVVVDFPDGVNTPWAREIFQRNAIAQGLEKAAPNDRIVVSDVDEIPHPAAIDTYTSPTQLDVTQYFWNYHWEVPAHCNQGARPVTFLKKHMTTPHDMRAKQLPRIPYGGWHFSFFSDYERIRQKIESFSHTEVNQEEFKRIDNIRYRIDNGIDPFDRFPLKWKEIDVTYPQWVQSNR
jgi:beta-1,4-mannosyl-glycoprotein beta-1,4-N-acetylglucosaminyltransferase